MIGSASTNVNNPQRQPPKVTIPKAQTGVHPKTQTGVHPKTQMVGHPQIQTGPHPKTQTGVHPKTQMVGHPQIQTGGHAKVQTGGTPQFHPNGKLPAHPTNPKGPKFTNPEIYKIIQDVHSINNVVMGLQQTGHLAPEQLLKLKKFDEQLTQHLLKLDTVQGNEDIRQQRKDAIKQIQNLHTHIDILRTKMSSHTR